MTNIDGTWKTRVLKRGLRAALNALGNLGTQGEPAYTTDTKHLFISDGTSWQPIQTVDMIVTKDGELVTKNGDIVIKY